MTHGSPTVTSQAAWEVQAAELPGPGPGPLTDHVVAEAHGAECDEGKVEALHIAPAFHVGEEKWGQQQKEQEAGEKRGRACQPPCPRWVLQHTATVCGSVPGSKKGCPMPTSPDLCPPSISKNLCGFDSSESSHANHDPNKKTVLGCAPTTS